MPESYERKRQQVSRVARLEIRRLNSTKERADTLERRRLAGARLARKDRDFLLRRKEQQRRLMESKAAADELAHRRRCAEKEREQQTRREVILATGRGGKQSRRSMRNAKQRRC